MYIYLNSKLMMKGEWYQLYHICVDSFFATHQKLYTVLLLFIIRNQQPVSSLRPPKLNEIMYKYLYRTLCIASFFLHTHHNQILFFLLCIYRFYFISFFYIPARYASISRWYRSLSSAALSFQYLDSSSVKVLYLAEMIRAMSPKAASGFSSLTVGRM